MQKVTYTKKDNYYHKISEEKDNADMRNELISDREKEESEIELEYMHADDEYEINTY